MEQRKAAHVSLDPLTSISPHITRDGH